MKTHYLVFAILLISNVASAQLFRPYKCGPVLNKQGIKTFERLNKYLGVSEGVVYAEVGASSGHYNGAMAVFVDSVTFYLQDIDEECLNQKNLEKVLKYYSKFRKSSVSSTNEFNIVIGTETETNLPQNTFDIIYSNATYHAMNQPGLIIADLHRSLKPQGVLAIRDEFVYSDSLKYCADKKCGNPLAKFEDFKATMLAHDFELIDQTDQFGHPVYKFKKKDP